MSNEVYANGREVSCKAGAGKSTAAFPDVCLTPPSPPAGPLPIPYPNTGVDSDTSDGAKTVSVSGKEVMLKDSSSFKKSTGDEAATKSQGMSVVTHQIQGKCYFTSWSMDVKIEGENAVRHQDMMTHNHASSPGSTPPWLFVDADAQGAETCRKEKIAEKKACKDFAPQKKGGPDACEVAGLADTPSPVQSHDEAKALGFKGGVGHLHSVTEDRALGKRARKRAKKKAAKCIQARRCRLVPYKDDAAAAEGNACCPTQTGDHLIPQSSFYDGRGMLPGWGGYNKDAAPVMCAEGASQWHGSHAKRHGQHKVDGMDAKHVPTKKYPFDDELDIATSSTCKVFPNCRPECIKAQLRNGHAKMGDTSKPIRHMPTGRVEDAPVPSQPAPARRGG
jgi:Toxin PAAR-like domain/GHH signature containing HNH/Endo VII superfamily nuclease toxin  2